MTGYFDALIRSSGMPVGRPAPAVPDADLGVAGIEVEHQTAATPSRATDTAPLQQTAVSIPRQGAVQRSAAADVALPPAQPPLEDPAAPATRSADPGKADLGPALVRAAMQWVAADAQHDRVDPPRASSSRERDEREEIMASAQPAREHHAAVAFQRINVPPVAATTDIVSSQPVAAQPTPIRATLFADATTTPVATTPTEPARDEVVEVSIGAIHVRVDAPTARTVTRPSPPVATARTSAPRPPRSALSRRALRRI